ncbi:MAG: IS66 family transposase, partial [Acidimicrobiales bacterium]
MSELLDIVAARGSRVIELEEALVSRDARIAELEAQLEKVRRGGKRQAAPFSKGQPSDEPARPGRKSGAAHGRHGRHGHRPTPADPDRNLDAPLPECCPDCGGEVELERTDEQFQTELPEVRPVVTKFRVGVGRCRACKRRVQGRHPEQTSDALGAAASQLGPRAKALGLLLHYELGLSFKKCSSLLGRFGVNVTAGAICSSSGSTSTALVPTHNAIKAHMAASPVVVMDETGWRIGGEGAWLWLVSEPDATLYEVAFGRDFEAAMRLIPADFEGVIVRDGYVVYNSYAKAKHQTCLAHLVRRCHEMTEDLPAGHRHTPRQVKDLLLEALD